MTPGIFAKQDIEEAIDRSELILNANKSNLQACSYDMRIGTIFKDGQIVNESRSQATTQFTVKPGEIISIFTLEEIHLPNNILATVFAINSQSSRGLLVLNPGHIDPGFKGPLTVKALNLRKAPLTISRGTRIFTIVFQGLPKHTTSSYNKNVPREQREHDFNAIDVEVAARNLTELVILGKDSPYPTRQEVKGIVQGHWLIWLTVFLTFVAALTGVIAVILTIAFNNRNINEQTPSTTLSIINPKTSP